MVTHREVSAANMPARALCGYSALRGDHRLATPDERPNCPACVTALAEEARRHLSREARMLLEVGAPHTHVATFNGHHWPAWRRPDGLLVDFRLFSEPVLRIGDNGTEVETLGRMAYLPDALRKAEVPEHLILSAGESTPPGFVLLSR